MAFATTLRPASPAAPGLIVPSGRTVACTSDRSISPGSAAKASPAAYSLPRFADVCRDPMKMLG
jgi:hypothetical protein